MIALDTNVLVRFLVQDDATQSAAATSLIQRCSRTTPAWLSREVLIETVWVLESAYGRSAADISNVLFGLLEAEEIVVEEASDVAVAAEAYGVAGADFADHMIASAAMRSGAETIYTFDKKAARHTFATFLVK